MKAVRCEPFDVAPGMRHVIRLPASLRTLPSRCKVALTRGRRVHFRSQTDSSAAFEVDIPGDAVQGVYKIVVTRPDGTKSSLGESVRVIDPAAHQGVVIPEYERWLYLVDRGGVPMKDVGGGLGYVRHPLVATYYALHFIGGSPPAVPEQVRERLLGETLEWLVSQCRAGPEGSLLVAHHFPLAAYGLPSGWISGLTQGRFAEVCARMFIRTRDPAWRDRARAACRLMAVPVRDGGLLAIDRFGDCCIEEYPIEPPNWALNGIGSAIASLRKLDDTVGIDGATDLIARVAESLDRKMDLFDCPDVPGSRVQLALPYSITLTPPKGNASVRIRGIEVTRPDGVTGPLDLVRAFAESLERGECRLEDGFVALAGRPASFALTLDGNRDPLRASTEARHRIRFRWESAPRGAIGIAVACGTHRVDLPSAEPDPRSVCSTLEFDANGFVPGGVGRIARYDETYHETNLIWMSDISGGGARPRSRHAMRRWVLSFCTGEGRVPVRPSDTTRAAIARAVEERSAGSSVQSRLERALLLEALGNEHADGGCRVEAVSPRIFGPGEVRVVRVLGIGFMGDEGALWEPAGGGPGGRAECRLVAGDELEVILPPELRGPVRLLVQRAGHTMREEQIELQGASAALESMEVRS
jgi:hypothetical protein